MPKEIISDEVPNAENGCGGSIGGMLLGEHDQGFCAHHLTTGGARIGLAPLTLFLKVFDPLLLFYPKLLLPDFDHCLA
jgi:hypothetical protein